jgi:hypothetical protein
VSEAEPLLMRPPYTVDGEEGDVALCNTDPSTLPFIADAGRVTELFGGTWPCFHDADIREVRLSTEPARVVIRFAVVKRDWNRTVDEYFVETHRGDVTLGFDGAYLLEISGWNDQNEIADMVVHRGSFTSAYSSGGFAYRVTADGLTGAGFELLCNSMAVLDVVMREIPAA